VDLNSKKLDQIRENDSLIYELIKSPNYEVKRNGQIWSNINGGGKPSDIWHRADKKTTSGYMSVNLKHKKLNVGRIVFAKYGNETLIAEKVINHKDGNKENNVVSNLEMVTHGENTTHRYRVLQGKKAPKVKVRKGRSGMLQATLDDFIRKLLQDENYKVEKNGTIWTKTTVTGKNSVDGTWREAGHVRDKGESRKSYHHVKYMYKSLSRARIVHAKFNGPLEMDLVVNHIDGDTLNDRPNNLELISQGENVSHTFKELGLRPIAGNRKINPEIAAKIRKLANDGLTNRELREKFKLAKSTISYVVNSRTWNKKVILG